MSKAKISVVMSVANGMPYLEEAIKSILNQTYRDFEFIIIDDASTDDTWQYLKSLSDRRIKLIKNKKNLGLASSLNKGLKVAKGDYIARMDADDLSLPRRLDVQLNFMAKNPDIDICGAWAILIDEKGTVITAVHKPTEDAKIKKMNNWLTGLIHPTWFAKKKVFKKLDGYNAAYDMVEDYDFLIRAKEFKMANIDKELLLWRSTSNRRSQKNIQDMYEKSFAVKWNYFKKGDFGLLYMPLLIGSFIATYLFPTRLKVYLNKKAGVL